MFFGEFKHAMDEKGRLRMPAKLKASLGGNFVVTKGTNACLFVFAKSYFEQEFLTKLSAVPTFDATAQKPIRMLLSSTFEAEEDGQGRFLLPQTLKEFAGMNKNVVFLGVGNRIEIWSEEVWNSYKDSTLNFDVVLETLGNFNV